MYVKNLHVSIYTGHPVFDGSRHFTETGTQGMLAPKKGGPFSHIFFFKWKTDVSFFHTFCTRAVFCSGVPYSKNFCMT